MTAKFDWMNNALKNARYAENAFGHAKETIKIARTSDNRTFWIQQARYWNRQGLFWMNAAREAGARAVTL